MNKILKLEPLVQAMEKAGINQAAVASELDVSREAVSKWFKGKAFPRPDKLLKLAQLVGLSFDGLVEKVPLETDPVIAFRKKGSSKTTDRHIAHAKEIGRMLASLVPYLSYDELVKPATLKQPIDTYPYIQKVVKKVRRDIGVQDDTVIDFHHLVKKFKDLQAVIVPVFSGIKTNHENALHIYLPDSMTTWVYLNLDVNMHDFKFWMAHELGHAYAPSLKGNEAEDFADHFSGALLFPGNFAKKVYEELNELSTNSKKISKILRYAAAHLISPITVYDQTNRYAEFNGYPVLNLDKIYAATTNFNKEFLPVGESLFYDKENTPSNYIKITTEIFDSPFFDVLKSYLIDSNKSQSYIQNILDISFIDAKGIHSELV